MSSSTTVVLVVVLGASALAAAVVAVLLLSRKRRRGGGGGGDGGGGPDSNASSVVSSTASKCPDVQATLRAHNAARARRGASPLVWDDTLASVAQQWSNRGVFEHSKSRYGENLAMGTGNCKQAVDLWVDEEKDWRPGMGFSMSTGHFTQVVWKGTKRVGCGFAKGIVTCNYDPPGNSGNYGGNV